MGSGQLNLVKLCVGATSVQDLADWQASRWGDGDATHVTRMWPKRAAELLDGGSLYWVIKGVVLVRQPILALDPRDGEDGIRRCAIRLGRPLVRTQAQPRRAFQGWRYLTAEDAPADLPHGADAAPALPPKLELALGDIGVL